MIHRAPRPPAEVATAWPVGRPSGYRDSRSSRHSARIVGPPRRWIAPSTPPPPSSDELAALTMASARSAVMSPTFRLIFMTMTLPSETCCGHFPTLRLELWDGCAGEAPVWPGHRPLLVIEHRSGAELAEALNQPGYQAGPPGLVCGTEPGAVVAVEVLVEQDEVPPVRVLLEQPGPAVDGTPTVVITQERADEAAGQLLRHLEQVHHRPRARRALDPQIVTVIPVVRDQGPDQ